MNSLSDSDSLSLLWTWWLTSAMSLLNSYSCTLLCSTWAPSNVSVISSTYSWNSTSCLDAQQNLLSPRLQMTSVTAACLMSNSATFISSASNHSKHSLSGGPHSWITWCLVNCILCSLSVPESCGRMLEYLFLLLLLSLSIVPACLLWWPYGLCIAPTARLQLWLPLIFLWPQPWTIHSWRASCCSMHFRQVLSMSGDTLLFSMCLYACYQFIELFAKVDYYTSYRSFAYL